MASKKKDTMILRAFLVLGLLILPFLFKKPPLKDWLITYLQTGFFATIVDSIFVQQGRISYPVRFFKKAFKISILFDYLLFPVVGVLYNQITYRSGLKGIFGKILIFSLPMTVLELGLESKTKLVHWKKWTWYQTFLYVSGITLLGRGFIGLIRVVSNSAFLIPTPKDKDEKKRQL